MITNNDGKKPSEVTLNGDIRGMLLGIMWYILMIRKRTENWTYRNECKEG
jgi:hypothetical protein